MIMILPAVMVLMGLFSVFVPKEMVVKYLGKAAGIKAVFLVKSKMLCKFTLLNTRHAV